MKNNKALLKDVQEALAKDPSFTKCLQSIYVLVNDGAVILAGSVDNAQLKNLASKVVSGVSGVNILIEDLKIQTPQSDHMGVQIDWAGGTMALTHSL